MTPELLALLRERPRRVHELVAALGRAPVYVEGLLRALERQGLARRVEGEDHVLVWIAGEGSGSSGDSRRGSVSRQEGPRFTVTTWHEEDAGPGGERRPHGDLWFARVVSVRPETAPFTDPKDEARAVVEARRLLPDAVRAAVASFVRLYHGGGVGGTG